MPGGRQADVRRRLTRRAELRRRRHPTCPPGAASPATQARTASAAGPHPRKPGEPAGVDPLRDLRQARHAPQPPPPGSPHAGCSHVTTASTPQQTQLAGIGARCPHMDALATRDQLRRDDDRSQREARTGKLARCGRGRLGPAHLHPFAADIALTSRRSTTASPCLTAPIGAGLLPRWPVLQHRGETRWCPACGTPLLYALGLSSDIDADTTRK